MRKIMIVMAVALLFFTNHLQAQNYLWAKPFASSTLAGSGIFPYGMTVYNSQVIITGAFSDTVDFDPGPGTASLFTDGSTDIYLASYDLSGNYMWAISIGSQIFSDEGRAVTTDLSGNIYVTGAYGGGCDFDPGPNIQNPGFIGTMDAFIAKYDLNGNYIWAVGLGGTGLEYIEDIAVEPNGNVLVGGRFEGTVDFDPGTGVSNLSVQGLPPSSSGFFARYDASGNFMWAKDIQSPTGFIRVAVDGNSHSFLTGSYSGTVDFDPGAGVENLTGIGTDDIFIARYDVNGNYMFAKSMGGPSIQGLLDKGTGIVVDNVSNIYITGNFGGPADFDPGSGVANLTSVWVQDVFFAKYDANGNYVWAHHFASEQDYPDIAVDNHGDVLVSGSFNMSSDFDPGPGVFNLITNGNADAFVAKYSNYGGFLSAIHMGSMYGNSRGTVVDTDASGNIYITGVFSDSTDFDPGSGTALLTTALPFTENAFLAKYSSGPVGIYAIEANEFPVSVYPNPVNTMMYINSGAETPMELLLYNLTSGLILREFFSMAISLNLETISSGVYIYELRNTDRVVKRGKIVKQ